MFIDGLTKLQNNIENSKDIIMSEEHTKMAFIVPFIQILGYDVFNPLEVIPEYTCDFGTKKGEKVDYCIMNGKQPYILVECKDCRNKLTQDNISQLFRYYSVSSARIAILTNGIDYMLFTDSIETNKMDSDPFYRFNILSISSEDIHIIKMLAKENINDNSISSYSKIALFRSEVDNWINSEKNALSRDFINFIKKKINTYSLPNEEISRIVISKLFQEDTSLDCNKNTLTVENESHKRIRTAKGTSGTFTFNSEDIKTAVTGSKLTHISINGVDSDISSALDIITFTLDYCLDKLGYNSNSFVAKMMENNEILFSCTGNNDSTTREYRGIYFKRSLSASGIVKHCIKILVIMNIDLNKCSLSMISRT